MSQPPDSGVRAQSSWIALDLRYGLLTLAYLVMINGLASRPELGAGGRDPLVRLAATLYHVPLYAGLGFFILQAISRGQALAAHQWGRAAFTFVAAGLFAMLVEGHQFSVPGRDWSFGNLLLDLAGVAGLLIVCALGTAKDKRHE